MRLPWQVQRKMAGGQRLFLPPSPFKLSSPTCFGISFKRTVDCGNGIMLMKNFWPFPQVSAPLGVATFRVPLSASFLRCATERLRRPAHR